jgi:hypothetical protein
MILNTNKVSQHGQMIGNIYYMYTDKWSLKIKVILEILAGFHKSPTEVTI